MAALGRVPVGINPNDADFETIEKTGGSKSHTHTQGTLEACIGSPTGNADALGFRHSNLGNDLGSSTYSVPGNGHAANGHPTRSHNTRVLGTTDGASTIQPYITCYMFKRTA